MRRCTGPGLEGSEQPRSFGPHGIWGEAPSHMGMFLFPNPEAHEICCWRFWWSSIPSSPNPTLSPAQWWGWSSHLLLPWLFWWAIHPEEIGAPPCHLINTNSCMLKRSTLWITKYTPITQKTPWILGAVSQEPGTKTKYISHYTTVSLGTNIMYTFPTTY